MTDLLDPDLRDVMTRLAKRAVPSIGTATSTTPSNPAASDKSVDLVLTPGAGTLERPRRLTLTVAAALVVIAIVAAVTLVSVGSGRTTTDPAIGATEWRQLAPSPLSPRLGSASVWAGDRWFIWGGSAIAGNGRAYLSDGATYDPATDRWTPIDAGPLSGRTLADAVWTGDEIVVAGGWADASVSIRPDAAAYDPGTDTWRKLADAPGPISGLELIDGIVVATVVWNERMSLSDYRVATDSWSTPVAADLTVGPNPTAEGRQRYTTLDGDRYVADDSALYRNEFGRNPLYSLNEVLQFRAALATDNEVLVVGQGAAHDNRDDHRTVVRYDPLTGDSRIFEEQRRDPGLATTTLAGNTIALVPDWSGDIVELFDLGTNRWVDAPDAPVDVARHQPAVVWTGDELLIWGGGTQVETGAPIIETETGAALRIDDPSPQDLAGEWREIAPSPLSPREEHVAVWTGTEMIIWGGRFQGGGTVVDTGNADVGVSGTESYSEFGLGLTGRHDGAAYDPATDTWRRIADAPFEGHYQHRAVWTRTEMIVIGRNATNGRLDAAAYDPATDAWRTINAPIIDNNLDGFELLMVDDTLLLFSGSLLNDASMSRLDAYDFNTDTWTARVTFNDIARVTEAVLVGEEIWAMGESRQPDGSIVTVSLRSTDLGHAWGSSSFDFTPSPDSFTRVYLAQADGDLVTVAGTWGTDAVTTFWDINGDGTPLVGNNSVESVTEPAGQLDDLFFDFFEQIDLVVTSDGGLIIVGGRFGSMRRNPDGGWESIGEPPVPVSFAHSGIWTGTDIIIWGGRADENGGSSVATGAAYRPS